MDWRFSQSGERWDYVPAGGEGERCLGGSVSVGINGG